MKQFFDVISFSGKSNYISRVVQVWMLFVMAAWIRASKRRSFLHIAW
jgi:hypothetical protein